MKEVFKDLLASAEYHPEKFATAPYQMLLPGGEAKINWHQNDITLFGKTHPEPRLTAWYGPPYSYASTSWPAQAMNGLLEDLRLELVAMTGFEFNAVLLNLYRDGNDHMGWHRDNEPEVDQRLIASISFGAARDFKFRARAQKEKQATVSLESGSLLLMRNCQQHHEHCLPKRKRVESLRLNLTYRRVVT